MEVKTKGSEVERVDKMWSGGWPGLGKGEGRVWGHQDTRVVGAEMQIKKKVQMRGNGEGAKGTCWAPAPGVGGLVCHLIIMTASMFKRCYSSQSFWPSAARAAGAAAAAIAAGATMAAAPAATH